MVKQSIPIFEAEANSQSLDPTWGKGMAEDLISQCDK